MKPRHGRIATFAVSLLVTGTTLLGGAGLLPNGGGTSHAAERADDATVDGGAAVASLSAAERSAEEVEPEAAAEAPTERPDPEEVDVPADSGEGRRVVFDEGTQQVWLVKADGSVARTYLVSGSIYDNLDPGTYSVFSRDEQAWGIDGTELRWMVRFTTGAEAAIGFHDIPVLDGEKVQTPEELGTPLSLGWIRQWGRDAKALWDFAPLGTTVVVVDTTADVPDQSAEG